MSEHTGLIDAEALRRYADRILNLRAERATINADMGAVFSDAKEAGFVPAMIRGVVREMEMEDDARATFFTTQESYRRALGLLADLPLGKAAIERATVRRPAKTFAEQPVGRGRGRPRKADQVDDALSKAREHLGEQSWGEAAG